jgi:hypothetical protein
LRKGSSTPNRCHRHGLALESGDVASAQIAPTEAHNRVVVFLDTNIAILQCTEDRLSNRPVNDTISPKVLTIVTPTAANELANNKTKIVKKGKPWGDSALSSVFVEGVISHDDIQVLLSRADRLWTILYTEVLANLDLYSIWTRPERLVQIMNNCGFPGNAKQYVNNVSSYPESQWVGSFCKLPPNVNDFMAQIRS